MVGTKHYLDYVEFLFYLQECGYQDFMTSDTSPTRWDIKKSFEMNARVTDKIWKKLLGIDRDAFRKLISARDFLKTWDFIENEILHI